MKAAERYSPPPLRRYYPVVVVALLVAMVFASTLVPHELAAFGLSAITASVLLLSAEAFEALLAPIVTDALRGFWRCIYVVYNIVLIGTGLAGILFMVLGAQQGKLHTAGSSGQYQFVLGVALLAIVVFALIPIWIARATLDVMTDSDTSNIDAPNADESTPNEEPERPSGSLLAGSLLFIIGTLLQFIALTQ
jgi:hypothetical protein